MNSNFRRTAPTPRVVQPSAVFAAFEAISVSFHTAADLAYRRPKPELIRLPPKGIAALFSPAAPDNVLLFPGIKPSHPAYRERDVQSARLPQSPSAALIPATPIPSISGTMSFTITDLTVMILVDRPAVTTWSNVQTQSTTWKAPLT